MTKYRDLNCILLVDDDAATNFIHEFVVEECDLGCHVQTCNGGELALDYLNSEGIFSNNSLPLPGIIFLDINMPGMDGWEFLQEYDKLPDERKAKVVVTMLTTSSNPSDIEKSKSISDVKSFLNKPLKSEHLMAIIEDHFEKL